MFSALLFAIGLALPCLADESELHLPALGVDYALPAVEAPPDPARPYALDVDTTLSVAVPSLGEQRVPASVPPPSVILVTAKAPPGNLTVGLNYVFPMLSYEYSLGDQIALGVSSLLADFPGLGAAQLRGYGLLVTVNYYTPSSFEGLWLQVGAGVFPLNASVGGVTQSMVFPALNSTVGWRWKWDTGMNVGAGLGATYLLKSSADQLSYTFPHLIPAIVLDVGFTL